MAVLNVFIRPAPPPNSAEFKKILIYASTPLHVFTTLIVTLFVHSGLENREYCLRDPLH
jgi:hypothetical protein